MIFFAHLQGEIVCTLFVFPVIFVVIFSLAYTCKFSFRQGVKVDDLETNHYVLVHGGGFGAWCWYKTIALLEESGYKVSAIDLTGSGVHSFDTNNITSLSQYVKPLTDFLEKLPEDGKVFIVLLSDSNRMDCFILSFSMYGVFSITGSF